ncbi:MAG: hypothetical protein WAU32_17880 [Thermoanaerobaculia bacterium]
MILPILRELDQDDRAGPYQKILHLRVNNAISDLILVEGVSPDFTVAGFARQVRAAIAGQS